MTYRPRQVSADVWHPNLTQRHQVVGVTFPAISALSAKEQSWVGTRDKPNVDYMPTVADVTRNPSDGSPARVPCEVPMHDAGANGTDGVPGGLSFQYDFGGRVMSRGRPQEAQPL